MSIMFDPADVPLARPAIQVAAFRYYPGEGFEPLPMVRPIAVHTREGAETSYAEFEYVTQNARADVAPVYFESILPLIGAGTDGSGEDRSADTVEVDDRVVVVAFTPDGDYRYLFDGFCTSPGTRFAPNRYEVGFMCVGVEKRCWDEPIQECWQRDCDEPDNPTFNISTTLDIRFNPRGRPNCCPENSDMVPDTLPDNTPIPPDERADVQAFPVFLDAGCKARDPDDKPYQTHWTLSKVAKYILGWCNIEETYVRNPDFSLLDELLDVYTPKKGREYYDVDDPSTYDQNPIVVADVDVTGRPWPEALADVLDANGFSMCFRLSRDEDSNPYTFIDIYKKFDDDPSKYVDLFLAPWDDPLDPGLNNLAVSDVQHDISRVENRVSLRTAPELVEVSIVLAPLFEILPADKANRKDFILGNDNFSTGDNANKYRKWGADEMAGGHWNMDNWVFTVSDIDLSKVFPSPSDDPTRPPDPNAAPAYTIRARPARRELVTRDDSGTPMSPMLHISFDYADKTPRIWDGTSGTWYQLPNGYGWSLLHDEFGIKVHIKDPNAWHVGPISGGLAAGMATQLAGGEIRAVEWLATKKAATATKAGNFCLMLTAVMEGDLIAKVVSDRRDVTPTRFTIHRVVDVRSEMQPRRIYENSWNSYYQDQVGTSWQDFDPKRAQAFADGKRESAQLGKFRMRAEIPRLAWGYPIGSRIRQINGRDCSFEMNLSGGLESACYPKVIGVSWNFNGERTALVLADADIARRHRRQ